MTIKGSFNLIFALFFANLSFAQSSKRIYYVEKLDLNKTFAMPIEDLKKLQITSAAVEIYSYQNGIKQDSLTVHAENLYTWKDSIAFRIDIPHDFISTENQISVQPIYHFKINGKKGNLPYYSLGGEKLIKQLLLTITSNPSGAKVYLIPKIYWERNPELSKYNVDALFPYQVSEGITTVRTYVQEYVYIAVFKYKNKIMKMPCSPNHLHDMNLLFADFNR